MNFGQDHFACQLKGLAKRLQDHPTLLNPALLDDVAKYSTRWPNECNVFDATLGRKGWAGTKTIQDL